MLNERLLHNNSIGEINNKLNRNKCYLSLTKHWQSTDNGIWYSTDVLVAWITDISTPDYFVTYVLFIISCDQNILIWFAIRNQLTRWNYMWHLEIQYNLFFSISRPLRLTNPKLILILTLSHSVHTTQSIAYVSILLWFLLKKLILDFVLK